MPQYHLYNPTTDTHYTNSTRTSNRPTPDESLVWVKGAAPEGSGHYQHSPQTPLEAAMAAHAIVMGLSVESRASHHGVITGIEAAIQRGDSELAQYLLGTITPITTAETDALAQIQGVFDALPQ